MTSNQAIEEFRDLVRAMMRLSRLSTRSQVLDTEFQEQKAANAAKGDTRVPGTWHVVTNALTDVDHHIKPIFEKHIGRLIVAETTKAVWEEKRGRTRKPKRKARK